MMLDYIYGFSCIFLPCILYQLFMKIKLEYDRKFRVHFFLVYIFLFYIFIAEMLLDIGHLWDFFRYPEYKDLTEINFIPVFPLTLKSYMLMVFYIPFGFLLPLIWKNYRNLKDTVMLCVLFSTLVEICKLFNDSLSDVTGVMLSITGSALGFILWYITRDIWIFTNLNENAVAIEDCEAENYIFLSVFGMFFLYNWNVFNFI